MKQHLFIDTTDERVVEVLSSETDHHLNIEWTPTSHITFTDSASGDYPNARMLSEALRDAIGYGPARDLLRKYNVDEDDPLMNLGRKG